MHGGQRQQFSFTQAAGFASATITSAALANSAASFKGSPLTASVNSEAEARQSAQPNASNAASRIVPPSTRSWTVTQSPQSRFFPAARRFAWSNR